MEKELGTHSEAESLPQILLSPVYLGILAAVLIGGTLVTTVLFL